MDYEKLATYMKRTDDRAEMESLGRRIAKEHSDIYTPALMEKMYQGVERHIPAAGKEEKETMVYRSIYDFWAHGCFVDEEFFLQFYKKTDAEKREYLVGNFRDVYINHLNSGGGLEIIDLLTDKYRLFQRLKPYYLRDMIEISDESDFAKFKEFVLSHDVFVVKPINYCCGYGVHKASLCDYGNDARIAFESILGEGAEIHKKHNYRRPKMVLEELIVQDETLAAFHPDSVNAVRATAVRGKDGKIHLFHPWIKVGLHGTFVASAALNGFDAEIDPETGIVITDGYQESGNVYTVHPDSGIRIKGFQIPQWKEMLELVDKLMEELPEYGYIGWDLVLTPKGWCVMEGNYSADFTFQLINGRGHRKEFEELIGWKSEYEYWWQDPSMRA